MRVLIRSVLAVSLLMAAAVPSALAATKDEGGVTFPIVVGFTAEDGTKYWTSITIYPNTDYNSAVYLRYQLMPFDGEPIDYTIPFNPIMGEASILGDVFAHLAQATGKPLSTSGALRVLPVDSDGKLLKNVKLSGFARINIDRPDGGRISERTQGLPDARLPGVRAKSITPTVLRGPHDHETRIVWITNASSMPQTYHVSTAASYLDSQFRTKQYKWEETVEVGAQRTALVIVPPLPDEFLNPPEINGTPQNSGSMMLSAACRTCTGAEPFTVTTTSINQVTGDVRVLVDVFSDR